MLIELWRKVLATDYSRNCCSICGNEFERGTVFPVAFTDRREEIGEMCPPCLDYVNRRKRDGGDPTGGPAPWGNWPAREWPTLEDLEEARRRFPEPMFADSDAYAAAAPDMDAELSMLQSSMIWTMEGEERG
jgi:hypothetical protein